MGKLFWAYECRCWHATTLCTFRSIFFRVLLVHFCMVKINFVSSIINTTLVVFWNVSYLVQLFEKSNRFKCSPFSDALHFDLYLLILPWGSFLFLSVQKDPKKRLSAHDLLVRPIKPFVFLSVYCTSWLDSFILMFVFLLFLFLFLCDFRRILSSVCITTWILIFPLTSLKQDLHLLPSKPIGYVQLLS